MNAVPAAVLSVLVQAKGINTTNAQLAKTEGVLHGAAGAAGRMAKQLATGLKYASLAAAGAVAVAVKKAVDFDKKMRNVNSIAQLSEKVLGRVREKVLELAGKTAQAPVTLAAGMYDLVSSGFDAHESLQILSKSARAATAGLTTTEVSTKAVAAVLNAYHLQAKMAGDTSDVLFQIVNRGVITFEELAQNIGDVLPFGASLGVNLREIGASIATMTKAGITAPETMTRIKAVMVSLLKPSEALHEAIKQQGFETSQAMLDALGFQGTLDRLSQATHGNKEAMAALFPNVRALGGALALTGNNSKSAAEDLKGMQGAAGATAKALSQQSKSISYQWNQLKATAEALAIKFGSKLLPELSKVMKIITNPNLSAEEKFTRVFDMMVHGAETALKTAVSLAEQYGPKIVGKLASSIATAWWHFDIFGKILGAAALIRVLGGPGALTATGKTIGRMFGLGISEGMATTVAVDALPAAAASMTGSRWLGTDRRKQRSALEDAGRRSVLGHSEAEALAAQGGIFATSERNLVSRFKGLGSRLARGVATWGLGGLVVGQITKELAHGKTGQRIGSALEAAGVGAAIGSAIAPGIGTALGAAGGVIVSQVKNQLSGPSIGDEFAVQFAEGFESAIGPRLQKAMSGKDLGVLGGLSKQIRRSIRMAVAEGAGPEALQPLRAQLKQVLSARDLIQKPREEVAKEIDLLRSGIATRMSDISEIFHNNIQGIDQAWIHGGAQWRQASAENMKAAVAAIRSGMDLGVIDVEVGQKRIKELMRNLRIVEGRDPYGIAQGFAESWKQAGKINNSQIDHMLGEMRRMPKGSREAAQNAMIQMAHALENKGELVKGSASRLTSALVTKFGKTNQQLVSGVARGGEAIAGVFASLVNSVSGYLSDLGVNVQSILKAFGVKQPINFTVKTVTGAAGAVGAAAKDVLGAIQGKQTGGFIVPGTGSGDRPGFSGEVGAFVLNREATRAYGFDRGGNIPLALEPGERYFTRREVSAMGGTRTLEAMNSSVPRFGFQEGGALGKPQVSGPAGPLRDMGQAAADKAYAAATEYVKAHRPSGGFEGLGNAPAALKEAMAMAQSKGLTITSTTGGEHAANSWHYKGRAFDASNGVNTPQEREYAIAAAKRWGRHILELFFDPLGWYIKNGQKISGAIGDHSDHVHTAMHLGGLIQALQEGGALSKARNVAHKAWDALGRSRAPEPRIIFDNGSANGNPYTEGGTSRVHIPTPWAPLLWEGAGHNQNFIREALVHEFAHTMQKDGVRKSIPEREGGATWFADIEAPGVWRKVGLPFDRLPTNSAYAPYLERVQHEHDREWAMHGQLRGYRFGGLLQALASGGAVVKTAGAVLARNGLDLVSTGGILGNSYQESGWDTEAIEPGTHNGGLFGFTAGEKSLSALERYAAAQAKPWGDTETQVQFMLHTLPQSMRSAMNAMASVEQTTPYFMENWEHPLASAANLPRRLEGAHKAVGMLKGSWSGGEITEGQRRQLEGKQRKANNERHLQALEQEVQQAHSPIAKQSKLWRLVKFWGRTGLFEQDEKQHILGAVQDAAAQTKPSGAVNILDHLSDYAKGHGEITGKDPSNFRDFEKAIERAQDRGREQRQKTVERQKKHVESVHNRVASKIANRAAFPELVAQLANLRRGADVGEEFASQLVTLEPENISDAYVDRERGAYGDELNRLLSWRNTTVRAQEAASREIANFEAQIASIEALNVGVSPGIAAPAGKHTGAGHGKGKQKQLGGWVEALAKGGSSGKKAKHHKPPADTFAAFDKQKYKIPLLEDAIANAKTMRDETWAGELEEIQGLTGPSGILESLPSEPVAGAFGGRIFEIQNSIRELALKVNDATSGVSELKELEASLNTDWHKRFLVSEAQRNTIAGFEATYPGRYAGMFGTGGVIGAGQWGIAGETGEPEIVHGPARVFNPSESADLLNSGGGPGLVIDELVVHEGGRVTGRYEGREFEVAVKKVMKGGRVTGRTTPGGR